MKKYLISILASILIMNSCQSEHPPQNLIGRFDISNNDSQFVFSFYTANKGSSVYKSNIDGSDVKVLISQNMQKSYFNPVYSPDEKKILFLEYDKKNSGNTSVCISDTDGSNIEQLTAGGERVIQAIWSNYSNDIYYCKANEYKSYSPIGRTQAHDVDIYSVNISTKKVTKVSNLKAYGMFYISEIDRNVFLMHMPGGDDGGIYIYTKHSDDSLKRIVPVNNPRGEAYRYYTPLYSKQYNVMAINTPYQLYLMDMKTTNAELLFDNRGYSHIEDLCFYNKQRKILFSIDGETSLKSINLDGSDLKSIPIGRSISLLWQIAPPQ